MPNRPIEYYNRYTQKVETEIVYGERFLRWSYQSRFGRLCKATLFKRAFFSRFYGYLMSTVRSKGKVLPFIKKYGVNTDEFSTKPEDFETFNHFFCRKLKPTARVVDANPDHAVFPADGRHLGFQDVSRVENVFVKGQRFDLETLLNDPVEAERYREGSLVLSRLCPVDYHRYHFPASGVPSRSRYIKGPLFSVNPLALRRNLEILAQNRRMITSFESDRFGRVILIEIGATCVGTIIQTYKPGRNVQKGSEKGYFRFGGSSIITLFEKGSVVLAEDLVENSLMGRELYAHVGDFMGKKRA